MHKQLMDEMEKGSGEPGSTTSLAGSRPVTVDKLREMDMINAVAVSLDPCSAVILTELSY